MAKKPFEIQDSTLRMGGVDLQAGTTGVVIPGVTQATNYRVEEVEDTDVDQTYQFAPDSEVVVIDKALYDAIVAEGNTSSFADYTAPTDDDGYIDDIEVNGRGTYSAANADRAADNDMYAYVGAGSASDRPLVPEDWITIPFRPKMRAGAVETIGGGSGGAIVEREVSFPEGQEGDTRGTIALTPDGETYVCTDDWTNLTDQYQGEYVGENTTPYDIAQSGGELNMVIFSASAEPELLFILQNGNWSVGDIIIDAGEDFGGPQIVQFAGSSNVDMSFSWTHRTGVDPTTIAIGHQATITYNGTINSQPIWRRLVDLTGGSGGEDGSGKINWTSNGDLTIETVRPDGYSDDCDLNLYAADDVFITANGDEVDITANTNVVIQSDDGNHQWTFAQDGSLKLPDLDNTGYQVGYSLNGPTLLLGGENNPTEQVIITGPVPNNDYPSAQRLIIQGQRGHGGENQNVGEGGDIYIWAGVGGDGGSLDPIGNGGDIKVRGGQGGTEGGYVRIEGGDALADSGTGGFIDINAGNASEPTASGGDVNIRAGVGGLNNGEVNIYTEGNTNHWIFKNDGALQLPVGGDIRDSNGVSVLGASNGDLIGSGGIDQIGTRQIVYTDFEGSQAPNGGPTATSITLTQTFAANDVIEFRTGEVRTITQVDLDTPSAGLNTYTWVGDVEYDFDNPMFPITVLSADYVAATKPTARIKPNSSYVGLGQYMEIYTGSEPSTMDDLGHIHMKGHHGNVELFLGTDDNFVSTKEAGNTPGHVTMRSESEIKVIETDLRIHRNGSTFVSDMGDNVNYAWHRTNTADMTHNTVAVDSQGNYYVGGEHANYADGMISKFSKDGSLIWSKLVGGESQDTARDVPVVAINPNTDRATIIYTTDVGRSNSYFKMADLDADGNFDSDATDFYDSDGSIEPRDMKWHPTLGWIIVGRTYGDELASASLTPQTGSGVGRLVLNAAATDLRGDLMTTGDTSWYLSGTNISGKQQLSAGIGRFTGITPVNETVANPAAAGAAINVTINYAGGTYFQISGIVTPGTNYTVGDTVRVLGSLIGGTDVTHDVVFTIDQVDGSGGIVSSNGAAGTPNLSTISINMTALGFTTEDFSTGSYTVYKQVDARPFVWTSTWKKFLDMEVGYDYGYATSVEVNENNVDDIYVSGYTNGSRNGGGGGGFIWKLSSTGTTTWIKGLDNQWEVKSLAVDRYGVLYALSSGMATDIISMLSDGTGIKRIEANGPFGGQAHIDTAQGEDGEDYLFVVWGGYNDIVMGPQGGMAVQKFTLGLEQVWSRKMYLANGQSLNVNYDQDYKHFALTNTQAVVVGYGQTMGDYNDNAQLWSLSITDDFEPTDQLGNVNGVVTSVVDLTWETYGNNSVDDLSSVLISQPSTIQTAGLQSTLTWNTFTWSNRILNANFDTKGLVGIEKIDFVQGGYLGHNPVDIPQSAQNLQVDDYLNWNITLTLADRGKFIKNTATPGEGTCQDLEVYIPKNSDVAFPVGSIITLINLDLSNTYYIKVFGVGYSGDNDYPRIWAAGETIHSIWGFKGVQTATLMKIGTNDWLITANNIVNLD